MANAIWKLVEVEAGARGTPRICDGASVCNRVREVSRVRARTVECSGVASAVRARNEVGY